MIIKFDGVAHTWRYGLIGVPEEVPFSTPRESGETWEECAWHSLIAGSKEKRR